MERQRLRVKEMRYIMGRLRDGEALRWRGTKMDRHEANTGNETQKVRLGTERQGGRRIGNDTERQHEERQNQKTRE